MLMHRVELFFYFLFRCSSPFLGFVDVEHISDSIDPPQKRRYTKTHYGYTTSHFVLHFNRIAFDTFSVMNRLDFSYAS